MWLYTTKGFLSIVEDRTNRENVLVRARRYEHLVDALSLVGINPGEIVANSKADYKYRVSISKDRFMILLTELAATVHYDNFKDRVAKLHRRDSYPKALHSIWSITAQKLDER